MSVNSGPAPLASLLQADDSSARLASLLDAATDAIITMDARQRIVQYNRAAERIFGWPTQEMLGQSLTRLIPAQFQQAHIDHVKRFGATGVTSRHMGGTALIHGVRANGEQFPLDASISQIDTADGKLFTVILRDVTEKIRIEQDKAQIAAQLSALVESAMDAIISVNDKQQIVLYNHAAENLFGWSRKQAIGQALDILIPERLRSRHRAHIERFAATKVTSRRAGDATVLCGLRANGEEFPMEASISQVETDRGKLFTVILRDITDRVRTQEEIRSFSMRAHAAIESEKTRVARELHDELAQSLTALKMDAIWMRDNLPNDAQPLAEKINGILTILDHTVVATRRIAADLRPLVLDDLGLVAAIQWLSQSFSQRTGVACELLVNEELELAEPYATAVFRIVQELLANVAKHAKASQVHICIERITDSVRITVDDNGQGFATDAPRKHASLGLMGLRERAELLMGRVEITSQPEAGTHVVVNIPVNESGADL
jgi:PAS domain S-box-containing protein